MRKILASLFLLLSAAGLASTQALRFTPIPLPDGEKGIGMDDLRFDPGLRKVLVPAGRTGRLDLIDPDNQEIRELGGFSASAEFTKGHGGGITSVDSGDGYLFVTDRTAKVVKVIKSKSLQLVAQASLAGDSDYVRFVASEQEVWVTEPDEGRIETFSFKGAGKSSRIRHAGFIPTPGGPESLEIEPKSHRAYFHLRTGMRTLAVDLKSHEVLSNWSSGCDKTPTGLIIDSAHGRLFVGCREGKAVALNLAHDGQILSTLKVGEGLDIIAYDPVDSHLYLPSAKVGTLTVVLVTPQGALKTLGTTPTAPGGHCVTVDDRKNVYVCDPQHGRLLMVHDAY